MNPHNASITTACAKYYIVYITSCIPKRNTLSYWVVYVMYGACQTVSGHQNESLGSDFSSSLWSKSLFLCFLLPLLPYKPCLYCFVLFLFGFCDLCRTGMPTLCSPLQWTCFTGTEDSMISRGPFQLLQFCVASFYSVQYSPAIGL